MTVLYFSQVSLSIPRLPVLENGESYSCYFQDSHTPATITETGVTCRSPDTSRVPLVFRGQGECFLCMSVLGLSPQLFIRATSNVAEFDFFFMISSYFGWKLLRPHHNRDPTAKSPSNRPLKATEGSVCDSCLIYCHLDGIFFLFLVKFINFVFAFPELNQISSLSHLLYVIWMSSSKPLSTHLSKYIKHSLMNGDTN